MASALIMVADVSVDFADDPRLLLIVTQIPSSFSDCSVILRYSPDPADKSLWTQVILGLVPMLRPRINPYEPEVTPRVAPTPTGLGARVSPYGMAPTPTGLGPGLGCYMLVYENELEYYGHGATRPGKLDPRLDFDLNLIRT
ncbi:hypothetical protein V6N12_063423 [Hibiscus sabdariffa]|uniref:PH domain-containing protein n=1 Tax=Hibiscus sabdariffa TaxID=183260 RepID=A0ABR2FBU9_9ROSI